MSNYLIIFNSHSLSHMYTLSESLSLFLYLSLMPHYRSLSPYVCLSISLTLCLSHSLSFFPPFSLSLSLSLLSLSYSPSLPQSLSLILSLIVSPFLLHTHKISVSHSFCFSHSPHLTPDQSLFLFLSHLFYLCVSFSISHRHFLLVSLSLPLSPLL